MINESEARAILSLDYCTAQREVRAYSHKMNEAKKRGDESEYLNCKHMWDEAIGKRDYIAEIADKLYIFGIRFQELCDQVNEECDAKYGFDY